MQSDLFNPIYAGKRLADSTIIAAPFEESRPIRLRCSSDWHFSGLTPRTRQLAGARPAFDRNRRRSTLSQTRRDGGRRSSPPHGPGAGRSKCFHSHALVSQRKAAAQLGSVNCSQIFLSLAHIRLARSQTQGASSAICDGVRWRAIGNFHSDRSVSGVAARRFPLKSCASPCDSHRSG